MPIIEVLLVEDSRANAYMLREAMESAGISYGLHVVGDGLAAMDFLRRRGAYQLAPRPDLIILDLNLPIKGGREVLAEVVPDLSLHQIPLVILTGSTTDQDVVQTFGLPEGCYMIKPATFEDYLELVRAIETFRQRPHDCAIA